MKAGKSVANGANGGNVVISGGDADGSSASGGSVELKSGVAPSGTNTFGHLSVTDKQNVGIGKIFF